MKKVVILIVLILISTVSIEAREKANNDSPKIMFGTNFGTYFFMGSQSIYINPALGADFRLRYRFGALPLEIGINTGFYYYIPKSEITDAPDLFLSNPNMATIAFHLGLSSVFVNFGLGVGGVLSYINVVGINSVAVDLAVEPMIEIGLDLGNIQILLCPSYLLILEIIKEDGSLIHQIGIKLGIQS